MAMKKKTRDTLIIVGATLAVAAWMLPGSYDWARAKYFGTEGEKKKAAQYGEQTKATFKPA